jgi:hypothetical protein
MRRIAEETRQIVRNILSGLGPSFPGIAEIMQGYFTPDKVASPGLSGRPNRIS